MISSVSSAFLKWSVIFVNSSTLEKYFYNYEIVCTFFMRYLPVCPYSYSNKDIF